MDTQLKEQLMTLSSRYETKEFLVGDPSWFMHQVSGASNQELLAFIAASLSYGSRKQFLPKIQRIMNYAAARGETITEWVASGDFAQDIPRNGECFYRLQTNTVMHDFLCALQSMLQEYGTMKGFVAGHKAAGRVGKLTCLEALGMLTRWFAEHGSVGVVPKNTQSSCKRLCMFLRWMVRDGSPVDLGLWSDIIDKRTLIIPMDTHVVQEANKFGLLSTSSASMSTALKLTEKLSEAFPDDPLKGDFALFGLGVAP